MNPEELDKFVIETVDSVNLLIKNCVKSRLDANAIHYLFERFKEVNNQ